MDPIGLCFRKVPSGDKISNIIDTEIVSYFITSREQNMDEDITVREEVEIMVKDSDVPPQPDGWKETLTTIRTDPTKFPKLLLVGGQELDGFYRHVGC